MDTISRHIARSAATPPPAPGFIGPGHHNGFLYVVGGEATIGDARLATGHVGWLDRPDGDGTSTLAISAGSAGARVILYAGEPQREPLVHHGPFVAGSDTEIRELFRRFRAGTFVPLSSITHDHEGVGP
jgi:hypothetical protein